jgi:hypothetical protein
MIASVRWAMSVRTWCSSLRGSRPEWQICTENPRSAATPITPLAISEKYGSPISWTIRPTVDVAPPASVRAWMLAT